MLLGDNPVEQDVVKTGAKWNCEECYGAPETQHQRHLLQGQPHCNQSSPLGGEKKYIAAGSDFGVSWFKI